MKLTEGLLLYEVVLLVLGVILFCALVWAFLYSVQKKRNLAPLLFFFFLPLVMIAFPAIQKVKFDKDGIEIENRLVALLEKPPGETPPAATTELKVKLNEFKARAGNSPAALLTIARAETALGEIAQSKATLEKAIALKPESAAAQDFKQRVEKLNLNTNPLILREAVKANVRVSK